MIIDSRSKHVSLLNFWIRVRILSQLMIEVRIDNNQDHIFIILGSLFTKNLGELSCRIINKVSTNHSHCILYFLILTSPRQICDRSSKIIDAFLVWACTLLINVWKGRNASLHCPTQLDIFPGHDLSYYTFCPTQEIYEGKYFWLIVDNMHYFSTTDAQPSTFYAAEYYISEHNFFTVQVHFYILMLFGRGF